MKQLTKLGMLLAFGGVLASCSNDKLDNPTTPEVSKGTTYAAFNIAMPSQTGTKADPTLDDGEESEYSVKGGKVILFKEVGANEDNYEYVTEGDFIKHAWELDGPNNDQITTTSKTAIAEFTNFILPSDDNSTYYALVILNPNKLTLPEEGDSFGAWRKKAQTTETINTLHGLPTGNNGMVMTNAPEYKEGVFTTLVKIDKSKVSTTSSTNLSPAAEIYVQRVASKVTILRGDNTSWDNSALFNVEYPAGVSDEDTPKPTKDQVEFSNWALDYTNNYTYPVQIADMSGNHSDGNWVKEWQKNNSNATFFSTGTFGRVYWALDPNYTETKVQTEGGDDDDDESYDDLFHITEVTSDLTDNLYCLENTMEYDQMLRINTTSFVLKGTYYVGGKGQKDKGDSFISYGSYRQALDESFLGDNMTIKASASKKNISLTDLFELTETGKKTYLSYIKGETVSDIKDWKDEDNEKAIKYLAKFTENKEIDFYKDGVVYYAMPIRHFTDDETPKPKPMESVGSYGKVHRGRYGMVRNNWYEIVIGKITGLGDPEVPTPDPEDPDDPSDKQYMDITIHILAWAKRSHTYDL